MFINLWPFITIDTHLNIRRENSNFLNILRHIGLPELYPVTSGTFSIHTNHSTTVRCFKNIDCLWVNWSGKLELLELHNSQDCHKVKIVGLKRFSRNYFRRTFQVIVATINSTGYIFAHFRNNFHYSLKNQINVLI